MSKLIELYEFNKSKQALKIKTSNIKNKNKMSQLINFFKESISIYINIKTKKINDYRYCYPSYSKIQ